jgi:hypothetical protein
MSVPVDLAQLADTLRDFGLAYLLTVADDQRVHAVAVRPSFDGRALLVPAVGRRTAANLASRPEATLLYPPFEPGGYSLIVDGSVQLGDDEVGLVPTHAVLHRPAAPGAAAGSEQTTGCGSDCLPIGER